MMPMMVETPAQLEALCTRVRNAGRVGLDTEFHTERAYTPRLMVVQLAFDDGAAIVDTLALPNLSSLIAALDAAEVVGHALASDVKIFADRFDAVPSRLFDCQVAASFLGYGMQVSLADLVADLRRVRLAKTQTVSDWSTRPFSEKQLEYLVDDVVHLLPMRDALLTKLRVLGRESWALEEFEALGRIERYRTDPRRALLRIPGSNRMSRRELGVLDALVRWRDELARERDLPTKYILPDDVLAGLATLRPSGLDELSQLRRLEAGARRNLGPQILAAIARGEALPDDALPEKASRPLSNPRETLAALMAVVIGEIARAHDLPSGLLVPRAALERVARELPRDRSSLEALLDLSAWRLGLVSEPMWRLLSGDSTLRIEGYGEGDPKIRRSS